MIRSARPDTAARQIIDCRKRGCLLVLAAVLLAGCASAYRPPIQLSRTERLPESPRPQPYLSMPEAPYLSKPEAPVNADAIVQQATFSQVAQQSAAILRLSDLLAEGLANNPEIRAARERWLAAQERVLPAGSLDDPIFSYTNFIEPVETRVGPQQNKFGISQKFPFFGKRSLKEEIAARRADEAKHLLEALRLDLTAKIKSAYYQLFLIYKSIDITEENVEILRGFAQIVRVKYATGKTSQQDVLKAEVRLSRLADALITLRQQRKTAEANLNVLLNRPPQALIGRPAEVERRRFEAKLEDLHESALGEHPLLLARQDAIERSRAALALAQRQYYPDLTVGLDYTDVEGGTTFSPDDGNDAVAVTFRVNVPLWVDRRNSEVDAARATLRSTQADFDTTKNNIFFDIQDGLIRVETAGRLADLFANTLLPQAEQTLEASLIGYQADKVDFLDLLDSQKVLQDLQLELYAAVQK